MAEQGTHKPLVPSSNLGVATGLSVAYPESVKMPAQARATRLVTPVTWIFAPDRLTVDEACHLSGWDRGTMRHIIDEGGVDLDDEGLIGKQSLHDYQECLALILNWDD